MAKHLDLKIYGKVQGVLFRQKAKEKANSLKLGGYAKNLSDKSVLIEIEGDEAAVEEFKQWCKEGPLHAEVERVTESTAPVRGYHSFEIYYI